MNLFDHLPDPPELQTAEDPNALYADVALHLPVDREFQYRVPEELRERVTLGARVRVPFRNRAVTGFCVGLSSDKQFDRVKDVEAVLDDTPLLSDLLLDLARWMAHRYVCSVGEALAAVLPPSVRRERAARTVAWVVPAVDAATLELARDERAESRPAQARILTEMLEGPEGTEANALRRTIGCSDSPIRTLARAGLVTVEQRRAAAIEPSARPSAPPRELVLTEEQHEALARILDALENRRATTFLVHGATGSGKTEVYLRSIEAVVSAGRQAIVLVPEISLTPQTVSRFRERFERVAVLHSHLTDADRREQWREIRAGKADVVIGARSAVFAPTPDLGLVVIDEEHESSFKQNTTPRYHARDAAVERTRRLGIPLVLGSATPSMESWQAAARGDYERLDMPHRVESLALPRVEIVDIADEPREHGPPPLIGRRLHLAMEEALRKREQILLFLNRRGHSTFLCCTRCGHVVKCSRCDITLTFHRRRRRASCHYCSYETDPPVRCPACKGHSVRYLGAGTEKIEDEVMSRFPDAVVARLDSDTARRRGALESTLDDFRDRRTDILVGTQMIAKGLDFPDVTVVGIISADVTLNLPDFRAAERTFQLVAQVAGRAGRSKKGGIVIVQTLQPDHACIQRAARHDFTGFASDELPAREELRYPPFARLLRILLQGKDEQRVAKLAGAVRGALESVVRPENLLGPGPAPLAYVDQRFRYHLLVKSETGDTFRDVAARAREASARTRDVTVTLDVDPIDTL